MGQKVERIAKVIKRLEYLFECILSIIYPCENYCIVCKKEDCILICNKCLKSITKLSKEENGIISYSYYSGVIKRLILRLKYKNDFSAGDVLAILLAEYIKENFEYSKCVLTYIPLSKKSMKNRGFNQCKYICKKVCNILHMECFDLLEKIKETREQKRLDKFEREENIKNAFKIKKYMDLGRSQIILIDDVVTTGSTLKEGYKILKQFYKNDIKLLTLAKTNI